MSADEVKKLRMAAHILKGLIRAQEDPLRVFEAILTSRDRAEAMERLNTKFGLDEVQATEVLDQEWHQATAENRHHTATVYAHVLVELGRLERLEAEGAPQA